MFFPILACSIIRPHVSLNNHPLYNHQVLKPFQPNRQLIANPAEAIMVCFRGCSVPYGQPGWKSHLPAGFLVFQPFWWFISTWVLYMTCLWWNNCTQFPMFVTWNGIQHTIYIIFTYTYRLLRYIFKFGQFMIELFLNKLPFAILLREHISFF